MTTGFWEATVLALFPTGVSPSRAEAAARFLLLHEIGVLGVAVGVLFLSRGPSAVDRRK